MAYVPLAQAQQQFIGGKTQSGASSSPSAQVVGGYAPLAQAQQKFLTTASPKKQATPLTVSKPQPSQPPLGPFNNVAKGIVNTIKNLPEAHFADKENFFTPVGFVKSLAQGIINSPAEAYKGAVSLGEHAKTGTSTPQQVAADIAAGIQLPLLFLTGGGSSVAKEGVVQTVKNVAAYGAKDIAKAVAKESVVGGAFGFLGGLQSGKNIQSASEYIKNLLENVGIGSVVGGGLGTATHVALPLAKGLSNKIGAVFVKDATTKPVIDSVHLDPKVAQAVVIGNNLEKTPAGKALLKESVVAEQSGTHVAIVSTDKGKYTLPDKTKVNIETVPVYEPKQPVKEADVMKELEQNKPALVDKYIAQNDNLIGADEAKKIFTGYTDEGADAFHKASTVIRDEAYNKLIATRKGERNNTVLFTAGGTGAGKSETLMYGEHKANYPIIYDSTFGKLDNARKIIKDALDNGYNARINFVYANPQAAWERVLHRGRYVPEDAHVTYHEQSLENIKKIYGEYKDNPNVHFAFYDNSGKLGSAQKVSFDFINNKSYNKEEVLKQIHATTDTATKRGIIKEDIATRYQNARTRRSTVSPKPEQSNGGTVPREATDNGTQTTPVGTGKPKESRAYQRLVEHLEETDPETFDKVKNDPKLLYNTVNQKLDFENAAKIVEEDPQKAYQIAKQYEKAPANQRWESVNIVLADKALAEKNYSLWKDLEQSRSLAQTRAGQGIVAERGRFNENSPHVYVQQVLDTRLRAIGKNFITSSIDTTMKAVGKVGNSAKAKALAKIDQVTEKAYQFTQKERAKINFAQNVLNDLICK